MYLVYLFLISILLSAYVVTPIRWIKSGFVDTQLDRVLVSQSTTSLLKFDIYTEKQIVVVRDNVDVLVKIEMFCFIGGYNNKSNIQYNFCKDKSCRVVKEGSAGDVFKVDDIVVSYDSKFINQKGIKLIIELLNTGKDTSGNYFCTADDRDLSFSIQSNYVQIRDSNYWSSHLFQKITSNQISTINTVVPKNLPQVFECKGGIAVEYLPSWINMELPYRVSWVVCPVLQTSDQLEIRARMDPDKCQRYTKSRCNTEIDPRICPKTINDFDIWKPLQSREGSLILTNLDSNSKLDPSYMLMCYVQKSNKDVEPITTYFTSKNGNDFNSGILFDGREQSVNQELKLTSPEVQEVDIYAIKITIGTVIPNPPSIIILYSSNSVVKYTWSFKGDQINSNSLMSLGKYSVKFIGDILPEMAGEYKLTVTQSGKTISAIVNVKVLGYPEVRNDKCIPPIRYVEEGTSTWISCDYINRPDNLMLKINSQEIKPGNTLQNSQSQLGSVYPYLSKLDFKFISTVSESPINTVSMNYSVTDMRKSNIGLKYEDHSVTFFVSNKYGLSIQSSSIYVVPKLSGLIIDSPDKYNCTNNCLSTIKHFFKCKIQMEAFDNKELIIDQFWSVENYRLDDKNDKTNPYARYFIEDPVTKDLTMLPIQTNDTDNDKLVKNTLKNSFIEYQVILKGSGDSNPAYSYFSRNDVAVGQVLKARVTMDYQTATASIYWIIALILILLILIIVIILLVRYCRGNKGESYPLDKLERKHGYDPEKEVQEELFKPYEREEHDPDMANGGLGERRLSMTNQSVGSGEDGELDNYDLDHSKFNEDGSIIGAYGANPRNRTDMA